MTELLAAARPASGQGIAAPYRRDLPDTIVSVVGMHRSGTSLVTRILNLLGVGLGPDDQLMSPHAEDNPTGYWENQAIVDLNDELLAALGGSWDNPPRLGAGWEFGDIPMSYRSPARALVGPVVDGSAVAGWKDPRMSVLLPFWKTVVPVTSTVLLVRHPFQVAASLATRDRMHSEDAARLWTRHTVDGWRNHSNRIVVNFDAVVEDPAYCAAHLAAFLGLEEPSAAVMHEVRSFADPTMRHHQDFVPEVGQNMALALSLFTVVESQSFSLVDRLFSAVAEEWGS